MNECLARALRDHYHTLQGYISAGMEVLKSDDLVFLNANENPYPLPGLEGLNRYPQPQPPALLQAYGHVYGVDPTYIAATRGADEAIALLIQAFCTPARDAVLIHSPTFGIYGIDAKSMPAHVVDVPLICEENQFSLDVEGMIAAACDPQRHVKMVFLCSPNNPTGGSFPHAELQHICKAFEGHAIVVLDETYAEFSGQGSLVKALGEHPNLIILRTLSKSYALAGVRMGCLLCADTDFIKIIKTKILQTYPLPQRSIEAALMALKPDNIKRSYGNIQTILGERKRMESALRGSAGVRRVFESDANFLLIEMDRASVFTKFCADRKVIIRDFSVNPHSRDCIRLTIGTPEQNDRVLSLLREFSAQAA